MRIVLVVEPGVDGAFTHVDTLARYLLEKGQEVSLAYSSRRAGPGLKPLVGAIGDGGGRVVDLEVGPDPGPGDARAAARLARFVRSIGPRVVHAHSSKAGALARLISPLIRPAAIFYTAHAYAGLRGDAGLRWRMFDRVEAALARVGTTIAVSADDERFAREQLRVAPDRIRHIPNPVDGERFRPPTASERADARAEFGLSEGRTVVGAIGRLSFQKDPEFLYAALDAWRRVRPDVALLHVGTGELERSVEAAITGFDLGDHVVRVPYLDDPRPFYAALDVLVSTSRYESLSMAVLEAMACDLPLVVRPAPGIDTIRRTDPSHLWVAAERSPGSLAAALEAFAVDRSAPRPSNHRDIVGAQFSIERCHGAVLAAYRERANPRPIP